MRIVTHNGHFHADELLAVATLLLVYPKAEVIRSRDEELFASADIVVDVGQIYDPIKQRFDHHQPDGAGKRENGIPYASFGLVWKEYGEKLCGGKEEAKIIEEKLVIPNDALDNGINISTPIFPGIHDYTIGDYFQSYAYGLETLEDLDETFYKILPQAKDLIERKVNEAKSKVLEWKEVEKIYNEAENKKIIVLPRNLSWKQILIPRETVFVVYPRTDGRWGIQSIPQSFDDHFSRKKSFPESWAGLNNGDLSRVTGLSDAKFCLKDRWMAGAESKEGAIKLAEIALGE